MTSPTTDTDQTQVAPATEPDAEPRDTRRIAIIVAVVILLLLALVAVFAGGDDDPDASSLVADDATATTVDDAVDDDATGEPEPEAEAGAGDQPADPDEQGGVDPQSPPDGPDAIATPTTSEPEQELDLAVATTPAQAMRKWIIAIEKQDWATAWALTGPDTQGDLDDDEAKFSSNDTLLKNLISIWEPWGTGVKDLSTHVFDIPETFEDDFIGVTYTGVPAGQDEVRSASLVTRKIGSNHVVEWLPGEEGIIFEEPTEGTACINGPSTTTIRVQTSPKMFVFANATQIGASSSKTDGTETVIEIESNGEYVEDTAITMVVDFSGRFSIGSTQWVRDC